MNKQDLRLHSCGNTTKAGTISGWKQRVIFKELVTMMRNTDFLNEDTEVTGKVYPITAKKLPGNLVNWDDFPGTQQ